jgi:hypothetical protein
MEYMNTTHNTQMPQAIDEDCAPSVYVDYVEALAAHMAAVTKMKWEWSYTGGGCDAMEWNSADGDSFILITDAEGACVPFDPMRSVTVGFYNIDGDQQQVLNLPTLSHALDALALD